MADIAQLGIRIDSTGGQAAIVQLDQLTDSAGKADAAVTELGQDAQDAGRRVEDAGRRIGKTGRDLSAVAPSARTAATGMDDLADAARRAGAAGAGFDFRGPMQQLSQVSQQAMATGDVMTALAIQAPDIGLAFGPIGIAAGVAAGLLLPLAGNLIGVGKAGEEAEDSLGRFYEALDNINTYAERARTPLTELTEQWGSLAAAIQAGSAELAEAEVATALDSIRSGVDVFSAPIQNAIDLYGQLRALQDRLADQVDLGSPPQDIIATRSALHEVAVAAKAAAAELGLAPHEVSRLDQAFDLLRDNTALGEVGEKAVEVQRILNELFPDKFDMPQLLRDQLPALDQLATGAAEANKNLDEANLSAGALNITIGETRTEAQQFADEFQAKWDEITAGIAEARGEVGLFGEALAGLADIGAGFFDRMGAFLEGFNVPTGLSSALAGAGTGVEASAALLRDREGFRTDAYWDVNAWRVGYGSDTTTDPVTGAVSQVTEATRVSLASAEADLTRRIEEFQQGIVALIGAERWATFLPSQQAALTSVAYNYGSLPDSVASAARSGSDQEITASIMGLAGDNGGVNAERRRQEAGIFAGQIGLDQERARQEAAATREATEAEREATAAAREAARAQAEQARMTEAAQKAFDGLLGSIDPAAEATQQYAEAQSILADAVERGIISQTEAASVMAQYEAYTVANSDAVQEAIAAQQLSLEAMAQTASDVFGGMIRDMVEGVSAADALGNALTALGDRLLESGLNAIFGGEGGGLFGGWLTGALGIPSVPAAPTTGAPLAAGGMEWLTGAGTGLASVSTPQDWDTPASGYAPVVHPSDMVAATGAGQGASGNAQVVSVEVVARAEPGVLVDVVDAKINDYDRGRARTTARDAVKNWRDR